MASGEVGTSLGRIQAPSGGGDGVSPYTLVEQIRGPFRRRFFIPVSGNVTESKRALLQYPMVGTSCPAFRQEALQKLLPATESPRFQAMLI